MSEILQRWLSARLGVVLEMDPLFFGPQVSDGTLLARLLHGYDIINSDQKKSIISTTDPVTRYNNIRLLTDWLRLIGIESDDCEIQEIADGKGSTAIRLFYQMYLWLENKDRLYFIHQQRKKEIPAKLHTRFQVESILTDQEGKNVCRDQALGTPLIERKNMIEWHKDKCEAIKRKCKLARDRFMKLYPEEQAENMPGKLSEAEFSPKHCVFKERENVFDEMVQIEKRFDTNDDKNLTYKDLLAEGERVKEHDMCQCVNFTEAKDYKKKLDHQFRQNVIAKSFKLNMQRNQTKELWNNLLEAQEREFDFLITKKLLKQSQYEKQMTMKLFQTRNEKKAMAENRILVNKLFMTKRQEELNLAMLRHREEIEAQRSMDCYEADRNKELHQRLYEEKLKLKYMKHYDMCMDIMDAFVDITVKAADFRSENKCDVPRKVWNEWKAIFFANQPTFDLMPDIASIVDDELDEETEEIALLEFGRQEVLNEHDMYDYSQLTGPWTVSEICPELSIIEDNQMVLGYIVHRLLDAKYPLPLPPIAANLPPMTTAAIVVGVDSQQVVQILHQLLSKRSILIVFMEDAINYGLVSFREEMAVVRDIDVKLCQVTQATLDDLEQNKSIKGKKKDKKESKKSKTILAEKKQKKTGSNKGNKKVASTEKELNDVIEIAHTHDKECQTPRMIPDDDPLLTYPAELGREAFNILSLGEQIPDSLLVKMLLEYLRSHKNNIQGWALFNYPPTYEQASMLEEILTGLQLPSKQPAEADLVEVIEETGTRVLEEEKPGEPDLVELRTSKLLPNPIPPRLPDEFRTYFTAYINAKKASMQINMSEDMEYIDEDNVSDLERVYTEQGMNYTFYYRTFDFPTVKHLAKLIVGDMELPLKTSVELFGEDVEELKQLLHTNDRPGRKGKGPNDAGGKAKKIKNKKTKSTETLEETHDRKKEKHEDPDTLNENDEESKEKKKGAKKGKSKEKGVKKGKSKEKGVKKDNSKEKGVKKGKSKDKGVKKDKSKDTDVKKGKSEDKVGKAGKGKGKKKGASKDKIADDEQKAEKQNEEETLPIADGIDGGVQELEKIAVVLEPGPIKPGDEGWEYIHLPQAPAIQVGLATLWENLENIYLEDFKEVFLMKRIYMSKTLPYLNFATRGIEQYVARPDTKQDHVFTFQVNFNQIDEVLRPDTEMKCEVHCRVKELQTLLWGICDGRKKEAEEIRRKMIRDNWVAEHMLCITNVYLYAMQLEVDRCVDTLQLLNDYYIAMLNKPLSTNRLGKLEVKRLSFSRSLLSSQETDLLVEIKESVKKIKDSKANQPTMNDQRNHASFDQQSKEIFDSIERLLTDVDSDHDPSTPFHVFITEAANSLTSEIQKMQSSQRSVINKENEMFGKSAKKEEVEPKAKGVDKKKGEKKAKPEKKKKNKKGGKSESGELVLEVISVPVEVDPIHTVGKRLIEEWESSLASEIKRAQFRLQLLEARGLADLTELLDVSQRTFFRLHAAVTERYEREVASVDMLCNVLRNAIEDELPIQHELLLEQDKFLINEKVILFPNPPVPPPVPLDEPISNIHFRVSQLAQLSKVMHKVAPTSLVPERAFVYILDDMVVCGPEDNEGKILPTVWYDLVTEDVPLVVQKVCGEEEYVDWKDFVINACNVDCPTVQEVLKLRKEFRKRDPQSYETVSYEDYNDVKLWFEDKTPDDPQETLRMSLLKELLYTLFRVGENEVNYTALLLYYCKDDDSISGFAKALSLAMGVRVVTTLEEYLLNEEEAMTRDGQPSALTLSAIAATEKLMDAVLVEVMEEVAGITIQEVIDEEAVVNDTVEEVTTIYSRQSDLDASPVAHKTSLSELNLCDVEARRSIMSNADVDPTDVTCDEGALPCTSHLPFNIVLNILTVCFPWLDCQASLTADSESFSGRLEKVYDQLAPGQLSVLAHELFQQPFITKLIDTGNRFKRIRVDAVVQDVLSTRHE